MVRDDPGGGGGSFAGIDPNLMARMNAAISSGAHVLVSQGGSLKARFSGQYLDSGQLSEIVAIGHWAEQQLPMLSRRQALAAAIDHTPGVHWYDEDATGMYLTPEEAARQGADLARRLDDIDEIDGDAGRELHQIALELERHKDDPAYTAALYARLGPQKTKIIPRFLAESGSDTAREDLRVYSQALGTALSAQYPPAGMDAVRGDLERPSNRPDAWDKGAMLAYAKAPADFLARVARNNALDGFAEDPGQDWRGGGLDAARLGLPEDDVALFLKVVSNSSEASRIALTTMGRPDHGRSLEGNIDLFLDYGRTVGTGDEVTEQLGHALASGSGADDERMGHHSAEAARFAEQVILAMGGRDDPPWNMGRSMAEIAGSYAPELVVGSDPESDRSEVVPGLDPRFSLDTADAFAFMKTFAATDDMARPFDDAMSALAQQMLDAGVAAEGNGDAPALQRVMSYLGSAGGLEYAAELEVRGDLDERDQRFRDFMGDLANIGLNAAPVNPATIGGKILWQVAQFEGGKLIDDYVDGGESRTDQLEQRRRQASLARTYTIADSLMAHGYPMAAAPDDVAGQWARDHNVDPERARFTDSSGHLLPPGQIAGDSERLAAYDEWMERNGRGGEHEDAFGQKAINLSRTMQGAFTATADRFSDS
jgi:hypothetical protein